MCGRRDVAVREDERRTNSSALACLPPLEGAGFNAPSVGFTLTREHRFSRLVTSFAACPPWKPPCARPFRPCCWPRCRPSPPIPYIGIAPCRERVCQYVFVLVVA